MLGFIYFYPESSRPLYQPLIMFDIICGCSLENIMSMSSNSNHLMLKAEAVNLALEVNLFLIIYNANFLLG